MDGDGGGGSLQAASLGEAHLSRVSGSRRNLLRVLSLIIDANYINVKGN